MADKKKVFHDIIDNFDWVDEDLNPILPQEYLDSLEENNNTSFELRYDALIKGAEISKEDFNKMVMHFKMEKDYDKVSVIYKAYAKFDKGVAEEISKEDENFLDSLG